MANSLTSPRPDSQLVFSIIDGMRTSKAVFAALEVGVFDLLEEEPLSSASCAEILQLDAGGAERLLDACVSVGLLLKLDGLYRNTPTASAYVVRSSPQSLAGYMLYANRISWRLWQHLEDAISEGTPRWTQAFGKETDIFGHFFRTDAAKRTFLAGMHGMGLLSSPLIAASFDLSHHQVVADLGGGTGHLAIAICEHYPHMRGTVFELPKVTPLTEEYLRQSSMESRIDVVAGDFFKDPLPDADLYCLGRILHDWDEPTIRTLLRRIHAALPDGGGLLLAEMLLSDDKTQPTRAVLQSVNMLVCTEGRERSLPEYRALLESEGFTSVQGHVTGQVLDAVYARKSGTAPTGGGAYGNSKVAITG
jgi:acetylserotonin N-methyltransferase